MSDTAIPSAAPEPGAAPAAPAATPAVNPATFPAAAKKEPRGARRKRESPQAAQGPGSAAAFQVLERLFQHYPKLFGAQFQPLKLGIYQELLERHGEEFRKDELKAALATHARSTRYLEAVASGAQRHGLDGNPVEPVAPEHVHHAVMEVYRRRQARSKESLQPWLQDRLVRAIEASGLSQAEYIERVNAKDDASLAALDAAFAAIAGKAAKREALVRAFTASGQSVEAFADMYGMDVDEVRAAVAPAQG
jgi:sRNA-binding protein